MDARAWEEQDKIRKNENQWQLSLQRAATGDYAAASRTGLLAQRADPTSSLYQDPSLDPNKPVGLARGGLAQARRPYLVGEKGPELIVPKEDGAVIPNDKLRKLQMILAKKKGAVPRVAGGDIKQGGAPPWPSAEDMISMAPVVAPGAPVPAAPTTIAPTGAADLAAAAAIQPPGFTPIRTSQGGGMALGTNDLGVQEIRTNRPSWQLYQGTGQLAKYPEAVANWKKEQGTHANDLAKAGLTAESHLEAARISKPYQYTEAGAQWLADAELKRPDLAAKAETDRATEADKVYQQKLLAEHGEAVTDDKGVTKYVLPAYIKHAALAHTPRTVEEVDAAMGKMKPAVETAKTINLFTDPAKSDPARASILKQYRNERAASGQPIDPSVEKYITTAPVGPHNLEWFKGAYQRATPKPAAAPAMAPARNLTAAAPVPGGPNNAWAKPYVLGPPTGPPAGADMQIPQY